MSSRSQYVLGSDSAEIERLDAQAALFAPATGLLLRTEGIDSGMRVLDLGTGLGHVARLAAELVGPEGEVVGIDQDATLLQVADQRRLADGVETVRFVEADVRNFRDDGPFDAVVGRLILFHLPDAEAVLRHHAKALERGGLMLAIDFDAGAARAEPAVPLVTTAAAWILAAFRSSEANPTIGTRLALLLREADLADVASFGIQGYLAPDDPRGASMLAGVVHALAPQIVGRGIATAAELGLDTLERRIAAELQAAWAVLLPPALVGAWGRRL